MAMDQTDVSAFLKAITAELKQTQARSPHEGHARTASVKADVHKSDMEAMAAFSKIRWDRVNTGLKAFTGMEKNLVAGFKAFGAKSVQNVALKFARTADILVKPLEDITWALDRLSSISINKAQSVLEAIGDTGKNGMVGSLTRAIKGLNNTDLQVAALEFDASGKVLTNALVSFFSALTAATKIDIRKAIGVLTDLPQISYLISGLRSFVGDDAKAIASDLKTVSGRIFVPLSQLGAGLESIGRINVKNAILAVDQLPALAQGIISSLSEFGSAKLVKASQKFSNVSQLIFVPLQDFATALSAIAEVSVLKVFKSLLFLPLMSGMLARQLNSFGSPKLVKAAENFKQTADVNVFRPLSEFASALKAIGDVSVLKLFKSLLFLPWMEGMIARYMNHFGSDRLKSASEKFKDKTELISAPLAAFSSALNNFADIPVARSIATALLLPVFFGTLRLTTKLMGDLSGLGKRLKQMKPIVATLKDIGVSMADAVGSGFGALGKQLKNIALGALAITLVSASLAIGALSFSLFAGIDWAGVLIGVTTLAVVALGAAALGASAPVILLGALAIAALGVALIPAAYAMKIAGEAMTLMVDAATTLIPNLLGLAIAGPGLIATALALGVLSTSMLAFSAATTAGGWLSKLGGNSIVDQVIELGKQADPLNAVANALDRIVTSSKQLGTIGLPDQMGGVGRGQTMITAQNQMATAQTETAAQPIVVSTQGGSSSQKSSVVNNTTNVSNSIMPDRMAGMMPSAAYSF